MYASLLFETLPGDNQEETQPQLSPEEEMEQSIEPLKLNYLIDKIYDLRSLMNTYGLDTNLVDMVLKYSVTIPYPILLELSKRLLLTVHQQVEEVKLKNKKKKKLN